MYKLRNISAILILASVFSFAQTSGPTQPDFMKFSQVNSNNNVNEFDGSFNYSIPVLSIPSGNNIGYSLQLTYQSGSSPNEEASWVGFGWNLNPGAILRQVKGFPDDFNNKNVVFINKIKPNITKTDITSLSGEYTSEDEETDTPLAPGKKTKYGGGLSVTRHFNNSTGYSFEFDISGSMSGVGGAGMKFENSGDISFSVEISPSLLLKGINKIDKKTGKEIEDFMSSKTSIFINEVFSYGMFLNKYDGNSSIGDYFNARDWGKGGLPLNSPAYEGTSLMLVPKFQGKYGVYGAEFTLPFMSYMENNQRYKDTKLDIPVFGYMYSGAVLNADNPVNNAHMDYYNEKESGLSVRDQNLPIPFNNADNFMVTGNGIAGSFKLYSKKAGLFKPRSSLSTNTIVDVAGTFGFNFISSGFVLGLDPRLGYTETELNWWDGNGALTSSGDNNVDGYNPTFTNGSNKFFAYSPKHNNYANDKTKLSVAENYFFKFNSDITYSQKPFASNNVEKSELFSPVKSKIIDNAFTKATLDLSGNNNLLSVLNNNERVSRSVYIDYNLFEDNNSAEFDINCTNSLNLNLSNFERRYNITGTSQDAEKLKEFKLTNKDGATYIYGLPVFNSNEVTANYIVDNVAHGNSSASSGDITNLKANYNYTKDGKIIFGNFNIEDLKTKPNVFGNAREMNEKYASSFLLTTILSPNYIDVTNDGPTPDDIGDYVIFNYRKTDNYKWREPYVGFLFNKNSISDSQDDIASMSSGEKEMYYLESIETKTHIAIYITNKTNLAEASSTNLLYMYKDNSTLDQSMIKLYYPMGTNAQGSDFTIRKDGVRALVTNDGKSEGKGEIGSQLTTETNQLERLEKIALFSIDLSRLNDKKSGKRIIYLKQKLQVINFEYDENYPIWSGLDNTKDQLGKLTLKKVWIDKEDVAESKVSKYIFDYQYHKGTGNTIIDDAYPGTLNEIPNYSRHNIDRWGNYAANIDETAADIGAEYVSKKELVLGINKINQKPAANYDPAAWNLKYIKLPNNGEIFVQYEQNEYSFVQNKPANILFHISERLSEKEFIVKLVDNVDIPSANVGVLTLEYIDFLQNNVIDSLIYFKFLYKLVGNSVLSNNKEYDNANEYIDGYRKVTNVETYGTNEIKITFDDDDDDLPYRKCKDFFLKRRNGLVHMDRGKNQNIEPCNIQTGTSEIILHNILYNDKLVGDRFSNVSYYGTNPDYCQEIINNQSYLRLPLPEFIPKKGGGIRVKRVINVDRFDSVAENSTEHKIYGNEYLYVNTTETINGKKSSSGVATNEPQVGGEENPLKQYLVNKDPESNVNFSFTSFTSGAFKWNEESVEQNEGPYCEGILPSPKVNYSKIITKSINSNYFNDNNIVVKEFNTVKDYPYDMIYEFDNKFEKPFSIPGNTWNRIEKIKNNPYLDFSSALNTLKDVYNNQKIQKLLGVNFVIPIGVTVDRNEKVFSQGYQFIINNMHGTPKSVATYSVPDFGDETTWKPSLKTDYEYYQPGEAVPIVNHLNKYTSDARWNMEYDWLGMSMEINNESRELKNVYNKVNGDIDMEFTIIPPAITSFSANGAYQNIIESYKYFVSNKIINLPSILKSTKNNVNGVVSTVDNVGFDPLTGDPVIKRTNSSYSNLVSPTNTTNYDNRNYYDYDFRSSLVYKRDNLLAENNKLNITSYLNDELEPKYGNSVNFRLLQYNVPTSKSTHYIKLIPNYNWSGNYGNFCKLMDKFHNGEIIRTVKTNSNNDYDYFLINDVQCDIMSLKKIDNNTIFGQTTGDIYVNIEMVKSSITNSLTQNIGKVITFGQESIIDSGKDLLYPKHLFKVNNNLNNYSTNNKWTTPVLLQNRLNAVIDAICPPTEPTSGILPFIDVKGSLSGSDPQNYGTISWSGSNPRTDGIISTTPIPFYKLKNLDGECVTDIQTDITINGDLFHFSNATGGIYMPVEYTMNYIHNGITYSTVWHIYQMYLEVSYDKKTAGGTPTTSTTKQRFNSQVLYHVSGGPTGDPTFPTRLAPGFTFYGNNELYMERIGYSDPTNFTNPPPLTPISSDPRADAMGTLHFNRSWADKFAAAAFCEDLNMDYYNYHDDKKVIISNSAVKLSDSLYSSRFDYLPNLIETPETTQVFSAIALPVGPNGTDTDIAHSQTACKNQLLSYIIPNSTKNLPKSTYLYDNTPSTTSDNIQNADFQSAAIANTLNANINSTASLNTMNFSGGLSNLFTMYNWTDDNQNSDWIETKKIDYNNNFSVLNEKDVNQLESGVGYDRYFSMFPIFTINKYKSGMALFEDIENYNELFLHYYNISKYNYNMIDINNYHTGSYGYKLENTKYLVTTNYLDRKTLKENMDNNGSTLPDYLINLWVKPVKLANDVDMSTIKIQAEILGVKENEVHLESIAQNTVSISYNTAVNLTKKIQIGEWYLFEGIIPGSSISNNVTNNSDRDLLKLKLSLNTSTITSSDQYLCIDDIRAIPYDADFKSFVYDWKEGYKIKAVLDNEHLPLKFIYNEKGELKSKVYATARGEKTLNEEFMNIPRTNRVTNNNMEIIQIPDEGGIFNETNSKVQNQKVEGVKLDKYSKIRKLNKIKTDQKTEQGKKLDFEKNVNAKEVLKQQQTIDSLKNKK